MGASLRFVQRRRLLQWLAATTGGLSLYGCGGGGDARVLLDGEAQPLQGGPSGASAAVAADALRYKLTVIIERPVGLGADGSVRAINEAGQIAGVAENGHALLYTDGRLVDLGTLGGAASIGWDINDSGQVSGTSDVPGDSFRPPIRAFLYTEGAMKDLGLLPGGRNSMGTGVNRQGQVTGGADGPTFPGWHAFIYTDGTMVDLGDLGGGASASVGYDINDQGQVVGQATAAGPPEGPPHAFLYSDGQMHDLGALPGEGPTNSIANAINESGQIAGTSSAADASQHAFLYADGQMRDLGSLAQRGLSYGQGINAKGWVVGLTDSRRGPVGFVHDGSKMHDLNNLLDASGEGWLIYRAHDINDAGQIVATALRGGYGGAEAGVLLTPVPC